MNAWEIAHNWNGGWRVMLNGMTYTEEVTFMDAAKTVQEAAEIGDTIEMDTEF